MQDITLRRNRMSDCSSNIQHATRNVNAITNTPSSTKLGILRLAEQLSVPYDVVPCTRCSQGSIIIACEYYISQKISCKDGGEGATSVERGLKGEGESVVLCCVKFVSRLQAELQIPLRKRSNIVRLCNSGLVHQVKVRTKYTLIFR